MSRQTAIILAITSILSLFFVIICCAGVVLLGKQSMVIDPTELASTASRITDFDIPPGYSLISGSQLFNSLSVRIVDKSGNSIIRIIQEKTNLSSPDTYLRQSISPISYRDMRWEAVETRTIMVRGKSTTLTVYTGTKPDNTKYHAWACAFDGKGGPAKLVIIAPEAIWDEAAMQAFVDSMH